MSATVSCRPPGRIPSSVGIEDALNRIIDERGRHRPILIPARQFKWVFQVDFGHPLTWLKEAL